MPTDGIDQRAVTVDDVATQALQALVDLPGVCRAGFALTEGGGRRLRFTSSEREGEEPAWCHIDAFEDVPLTAVVRTGRPVQGTLPELADRFPEFVGNQSGTAVVALASAPVAGAGEVLGGLVVYLDDVARLDAALTARVREVAAAAGADLTRVRGRGGVRPAPAADAASAAGLLEVEGAAGVPAVRRSVRELLHEREVRQEAIDDALVCLSEVVTNAVLHTAAAATVRLDLDDAELRVAVTDAGSGLGHRPGVVEPGDALRVHGRGLQIVEALARDWGVRTDRAGTTVWFAVDLAGPPG